MIINDSNKEQVFDGLINRIYTLEEMRLIKEQFDKNPELLKEYQFHKLVVQASNKVAKQQLKEQLIEKGVSFEERPFLVGILRNYPIAIAASVCILLTIGYLLIDSPSPTSAIAQQVEIQAQEITRKNLGLAGESDTTNLTKTILMYPDDKEQGYAFRNDTLVLYGKFDPKIIRYQYNIETQERKLLIGKETEILEYVTEKKKF
ncbi:hypothetical protein [Emticicia fontis]